MPLLFNMYSKDITSICKIHRSLNKIFVPCQSRVWFNHSSWAWFTQSSSLQANDILSFSKLQSVSQFSRSVMSNSLWHHESQQARPPCPSQTPEFTQTHAHRVGDAIQPSHPLSSPSLPAPSPSLHQGLYQRVNSSHQVAKVLEFQLQHQSFQWTPKTDLL